MAYYYNYTYRSIVFIFIFLLGTLPDIANAWIEQQLVWPDFPEQSVHFGANIAVSGDTMVVGTDPGKGRKGKAFSSSDAVYVYTRSGFSWTLRAALTPSDSKEGMHFGFSVAIDNDTIVVGTANKNKQRQETGSVVYVFQKHGSSWKDSTEDTQLSASDGSAYDLFGHSVGVFEDTIVVGSPKSEKNKGAAYIFEKPVSGWGHTTEKAKLMASDGQTNDRFGWSIGISGDTVVVGATGEDGGKDDPFSGSGSAYVFTKPAGGWKDSTENAKLTASDKQSYDDFGCSISVSNDTVVIGAQYERGGPGDPLINSGAVYLFTKPADGWHDTEETAKLNVSDAKSHDLFGNSVAISSDTVIVGAKDKDGMGRNGMDLGAAYIFTKPSSGWKSTTEDLKLQPSVPGAGDNFGYSVAISGATVAVSASGKDLTTGNAAVDCGAAYVFIKPTDLTPPEFTELPMVTAVRNDTALIKFDTDEESYATIFFGSESVREQSLKAPELTKEHNVLIKGLKPNTAYAFQVNITDHSGNSRDTKKHLSFTTTSKPDITAPVISGYPEFRSLNETSVEVEWQSSEPCSSMVDYGFYRKLGFHIENKDFVTRHKVQLRDLHPNKVYFIRVGGSDPAGNGPTYSKIFSFKAGTPEDTAIAAKIEEIPQPAAHHGEDSKELQIQLTRAEETIWELQKKLTFAEQDKWRVDILRSQLAESEAKNKKLTDELKFFRNGEGSTDVLQKKVLSCETSLNELDEKLTEAEVTFRNLQSVMKNIKNRQQ